MVEQGIDEGLIEDLDPVVIVTGIFSILQWFPVWLNRSHAANPEPVIDGRAGYYGQWPVCSEASV